MPLSVGDKLGPYEILAPLGAGGMGEVYRARDKRLRRDVAIKVSAERFTERFEKEARAIASLNHPNVCTLHDVGPNYLVMELVEGQTLAERIKLSAIPLDEALGIAKQIADALDAAHEKGITHRDLKPGNINIKPDGTVKVLDFGLAKMGGAPTAQSDNSPTLTVGPTQAGMILGTAAYMSPEQARGKEVDSRADIWAFGVVLYEMLTGQKLFEGDDLSETLASVIKEQPALERAPAKVQRLLRSCLEKDPKLRLQAIGDWRLLLEDRPPARSHASKLAWAVAAVLSVVAVVALWAPWHAEKPVDLPLVRLDVDLGADVSLPVPTSTVAISPDGTRLAYLSGRPAKLFTRRLDQAKGTELPGTQGASTPFFSPDGRWVGFGSNGMLNKISMAGGVVVPIGNLGGSNFAGASWSEDGSIFVSIAYQRGLLRTPAGGGPPESVAGLGDGDIGLNNPQILPGGKVILFSVDKALGQDRKTIEVLTLADRHRKVVARGGSFARYLPTSSGVGHLVYVNRGTMFAIPFDLAKLETRGTAVPVLDDVAHSSTGSGQFDFSLAPSGHGTLVYRRASGGEAGMATLQWVAQTGKIEPLRAKPGLYSMPRLSPDGKQVALTVFEGGSPDVWVYDPQRDAMTRLTFGGAMYRWETWSPDGQYLVFTSDGNGIFQARGDGVSQPQALMHDRPFQFPCSFTPDGKRLAYFEAAGNYQIWTVPLEDMGGRLKAGKPEQFLKSSFNDIAPSFSPDGRWLAYSSDESGKFEVYVRAFPSPSPGQGGKWQISNSGAMWPHWSRSGHEIVYQSGDQAMAVSYTVRGDTFLAEKPRVWIAKLGATSWTGWDLAPDGKGLLVSTPVESAEAPKQEHEVVFLENFFDELRRRVPLTGK
jgi:serine/threonine-protein kinase